jgi:hypothetical protein
MSADDEVKWTDTQIAEARKALLKHYTDQQNGQITRLVGFAIGLFTLLQLSQTLSDRALSQVFPNFPIFIQFTISWEGDVLKVIFLFVATWAILYFILRSIFRFAYYGHLSSEILYTTEDEAKNVVHDEAVRVKRQQAEFAQREIWALSTATARRLYDKKKIYGLPAKWFFSLQVHPNYVKCDNQGFRVLLLISLALAFLLLLFLW